MIHKLTLLLSCICIIITTNAQNWLTTGNSGLTSSNFVGTTDNISLVFKAKGLEGGRLQTSGAWRFGKNGTDNAIIDAFGKLSFNGAGAYNVGDNRYVFKYSANPTKGLFFNTTQNQYQFLNGSGTPLLFVHTDNGNSGVLGNFKIGAYTLPNTDGTSGQVLSTNGSGVVSWSTLASGGANTTLSNLTTTAVNQSLIPFTDSALDLGNKSKAWRNLFVDGKVGINVDPFAKLDIRAAGASASTSSLRITNTIQLGLINTLFTVRDDGRVGIGTASPAAALDVVGDAVFTTTNTDCDLRQKTSNTDMGWYASGSSTKMGLYNYAAGKTLMTVLGTGNVGIGTSTPAYKLDVCGNLRAKEIMVQTGWCDYVFDKSYQLRPLEEVEEYISQNKHLPNIPPATEVETNGLKIADMSAKMMEKIEELTLYIIDLNKRINALEQENTNLKNKITNQN